MKVYVLENRAYLYLFHWVVFMIAGLRHLPKNEDGSPIKIYLPMPDAQSYHKESLEIIKDAYQMVTEKEIGFTTRQHHHGEPLLRNDFVDGEAYKFLRELYLSRLPVESFNPHRKVYISRSDSVASNSANMGKIVRQITNEMELREKLQKLGFEIIVLSELSFADKIKLFQSAGIILSPHGSALVFSIFANPQCKIVEILPDSVPNHDHYKLICQVFNHPYHRFSGVDIVGDHPSLCSQWNMHVSLPSITTFLQPLISISD